MRTVKIPITMWDILTVCRFYNCNNILALTVKKVFANINGEFQTFTFNYFQNKSSKRFC